MVCSADVAAQKQFPPRPLPILEDPDCTKLSSADLDRLLGQLKTERDGLDGDVKTLAKHRDLFKPPLADESQLQAQLKQALRMLEQRRLEAKSTPTTHIVPQPVKPIDPPKKDEERPPAQPIPEIKPSEPNDPLALAHLLFRAEKYDEALTAFKLVDLKGRTAEERVPIQFLIARCLLHVGKNQEAAELLREAANARGDERFAGYAQWQLEMLRWERDVVDRLQKLRQRRQGTEPQP